MELVELFDNKRRPLDKVIERYGERGDEYTQVVHAWIRNSKGEFLMQKRSMNKKFFPGKWSVTGGGADAGETTLDALIRETKEEIGVELSEDEIELMMSIRRRYAFVDVYMAKKDLDINSITLQKEEVEEVKWASKDEIKEMIANGDIASSVKMYFSTLCELIENSKK